MFKAYYWRDEPILDIEQWLHDRGERMVVVTWLIKDVNPFAKRAKNVITYHEETEEIPEPFFKSLRITDDRIHIRHHFRDPIIKVV